MESFTKILSCCFPCMGGSDSEITNNSFKVIIKSRCCRKEKVIINISHNEMLEEDLDKFLLDVKTLILKNKKDNEK